MKNGKKKTQGFIEIQGTIYYTVAKLATMHDVTAWTIRRRIEDLSIIGIAAHGEVMYPDDKRFDKIDKRLSTPKKSKSSLSNYATLFQMVKAMDEKVTMILDHLTNSSDDVLKKRVKELEEILAQKNKTLSNVLTKQH